MNRARHVVSHSLIGFQPSEVPRTGSRTAESHFILTAHPGSGTGALRPRVDDLSVHSVWTRRGPAKTLHPRRSDQPPCNPPVSRNARAVDRPTSPAPTPPCNMALPILPLPSPSPPPSHPHPRSLSFNILTFLPSSFPSSPSSSSPNLPTLLTLPISPSPHTPPPPAKPSMTPLPPTACSATNPKRTSPNSSGKRGPCCGPALWL